MCGHITRTRRFTWRCIGKGCAINGRHVYVRVRS